MLTLRDVFSAVSIFLYVVRTAILIYAILSWLRPDFRLFYMLESFVKPFIVPFRRLSVWLMSKFRRPIDFSCWFALIGISIVDRLMWRLYYLLSMIP